MANCSPQTPGSNGSKPIPDSVSSDQSQNFGMHIPNLDRITPTQEVYGSFEEAYDHFNITLFNGDLPSCLITLQRRKNTYGYFAPNRHVRQGSIEMVDEIALNPDLFVNQTEHEVLAVLAHEMVHMWQHHFGRPGRGGYHNAEWAQKMKDIGLHPTDTGLPGGKETGDRVLDYIVPDGPFEKTAGELFASGFRIEWVDTVPEHLMSLGHKPSKKRSGKRTKYTCQDCGLNAWAKSAVHLRCGVCRVDLLETLGRGKSNG